MSSTINLGMLQSFAGYTAVGAVTNAAGGKWTGNAGTGVGAVSGLDGPPSFNGNVHIDDATTTQCKADLTVLYNALIGLPVNFPDHAPAFGGVALGGETIPAGVYFVNGAGSIAGTLTLDGGGNPNAFFIIKFKGAMTVGAGAIVNLTNGTQSCNVFFIADGAIPVAASANLKGNLIANIGAIGLAASCILEGRMLTLGGAITNGASAALSVPSGVCTIPTK
jgi:hypothetical protein